MNKFVKALGLLFSVLAPVAYGTLSWIWDYCGTDSICEGLAWGYSMLWLMGLSLLFLVLGFGFSLKYYTQSVFAKIGLMISVSTILIVIIFVFNDPDIVPSILTSIFSAW